MAKKNFSGGLASLLGPSTKEDKEFKDSSKEVRDNRDPSDMKVFKDEVSKQVRHDALMEKAMAKQSENDKLRFQRGYGRKTFIMDAELSDQIAAWAWYNRVSEKEMAARAFELYFSQLDPAELARAQREYNKRG